jgi:hypothetical protein
MPPGQEAIPDAQTSVPAEGAAGSPVKTMSRNTVPDMKMSIAGESPPRNSASGSHNTGSWGVSTLVLFLVLVTACATSSS